MNGNAAYRARWPEVDLLATRATVDAMRGPGARWRAEELPRLAAQVVEREGLLLERLAELEPSVVLPAHGGGARPPSLLEAEAALVGDLVRLAREAAGRTEAAEHVHTGLERHRTFLAGLGVSDRAFEEWTAEAAEQALAQVREN